MPFDVTLQQAVGTVGQAHALGPVWKRVVDFSGAALLLVALSPLLIAIGLVVRCGGGSALFRHRRIGQRGREFDCFKFRTMVPNAEAVLHELLEKDHAAREEWARDHKLRKDPRITAIGRFLRKTSLDELPQLINVLRGEMSLVGPRPIVLQELPKYGRTASKYLAVKPGITGLWQVTGRNNTDYQERVALDRYYMSHLSLRLDLAILFRTIPAVLLRSGAY
ncbi:MAG: sugar transferase [Pseudomonadota bacterium]